MQTESGRIHLMALILQFSSSWRLQILAGEWKIRLTRQFDECKNYLISTPVIPSLIFFPENNNQLVGYLFYDLVKKVVESLFQLSKWNEFPPFEESKKKIISVNMHLSLMVWYTYTHKFDRNNTVTEY